MRQSVNKNDNEKKDNPGQRQPFQHLPNGWPFAQPNKPLWWIRLFLPAVRLLPLQVFRSVSCDSFFVLLARPSLTIITQTSIKPEKNSIINLPPILYHNWGAWGCPSAWPDRWQTHSQLDHFRPESQNKQIANHKAFIELLPYWS